MFFDEKNHITFSFEISTKKQRKKIKNIDNEFSIDDETKIVIHRHQHVIEMMKKTI